MDINYNYDIENLEELKKFKKLKSSLAFQTTLKIAFYSLNIYVFVFFN